MLALALQMSGERHLLCRTLPWTAEAVWTASQRKLFKLREYSRTADHHFCLVVLAVHACWRHVCATRQSPRIVLLP
jgi:hypothetical protein